MTKLSTRIKKLIFLIVATLFLLITFLGVFMYLSTESYLKKNLSEWVDKESDQLYQLTLNNLNLHLFPLTIKIEDINLTTNVENVQMLRNESPNEKFYEFHSKEIILEAISWPQLWKNRVLHCKKLSVNEPELELTGESFFESDSVKTFDRIFQVMQPIFSKTLKKIVIDEVNIINANYEIYATPVDLFKVSDAKHISLTIKNFKTDSSLIFNTSKFFESDDIILKMNNFSNYLGDSLHIFTIDTLEYSLKTTDVFVHGFHLINNRVLSDKNLFDVFVPDLHLKSKSITHFFSLGDSLYIDYIEFKNPKIKFYQKENPKRIDIENLNQFNLYSLIENQFTKVEADSFRLINADIEIFHQPELKEYQQQLKSVDVILSGFKLDSISSFDQNRLFHANEINMEVKDYHLRLEDNMHEFRADTLFVSTTANLMGARNIKISPLIENSDNIRNEVNIRCKKVDIDQVNLKTVYHTRKLPTRSIIVEDPVVNLGYHTEIKKTKQKEPGLFIELVMAYLKGVYSDVVIVENGSLRIQHSLNSKVQGYFETGFNFALSGFALDSSSVEKTDKLFYATDFDLRFSDYEMKLVDNLHKLKVDSVEILSTNSKLEITNLSLQPEISSISLEEMEKLNRSELYHIFIPRITLQGVLLRDAFFHNKLTMNNFKISNPKIHFENFGALKQNNTAREFDEFYELIFNYIDDFNIKGINIPDGEFTWINHTKKGKTISFDNAFSANLFNVRLNETELTKKRLFFSEDFEISVMDQNFLLSDSVHILYAGEINLSTVSKSVNIKNASLHPDNKSVNYNNLKTTYQIAIPKLVLSNIDFSKAYQEKDLFLDKLNIDDPKFRIYSKKGDEKALDLNKFKVPMPTEIHSVKINELNINNGQVIMYETEGIKQQAKSTFNIDLQLPEVAIKCNDENSISFTTKEFISRISNFNTTLGNLHKLDIKLLSFNRENKNILVTDLNIKPSGPINNGNSFSVKVPNVRVTGFDVDAAIKENNFIFDVITVADPEIDIHVIDSVKGDKFEFTKNPNLFPYISPYVNKLEINKLDLNNVDLTFNRFQKKLIDRKFNIDFKDILISDSTKNENLLHAQEFEIITTGIETKSKNGMYRFSADTLIYNSVKHNVLLKNAGVTPLLSLEEFNKKSVYQADYVNASTNQIELTGINESEWLQNNILKANALIIGNTNAEIFRNKRYPFNVNQRPPWPQDLLQNIKQTYVFDSIILKPSNLKYQELMDISDFPGEISFNSLKLKTTAISNSNDHLNTQFTIWAETKIMNQSVLTTTFKFDLSSKNYAHTVVGNLQPITMNTFNKIVEKSAPFSIESGQINRFDFNILLNNNQSTGELYFAFDDFKINVLNITEDEIRKSKFATFWANKMMLNSQNPKGKNELQPVIINYKRDEQRSIINYWWKSIFSATKQAIGIKEDN